MYVVMQDGQGKLLKSCRSKCRPCWKLRYTLFQAFILLQQWMGRQLTTFNKLSVDMLEMRYLQLCELFLWPCIFFIGFLGIFGTHVS